MDRVLIVTPFRNEDHSFPYYLNSILSLSYPHDLIDLYWLENDSSDTTLSLLKQAIKFEEMNTFHSVKLDSVNLMGQVEKRKYLEYWKDIPYSKLRKESWFKIWNNYLLPYIHKLKTKYVIMFMADSVPPPNLIEGFLEAFRLHEDCGWVGGIMYRRFPRHKELIAPWLQVDTIKEPPKQIARVRYCGHCHMLRSEDLKGFVFKDALRDMHFSIVNFLEKKGLHVYCNPFLKIEHVSNDGKIYHV